MCLASQDSNPKDFGYEDNKRQYKNCRNIKTTLKDLG